MGGRVALRVALARPERVRSLVLVSASPGIAGDAARAARVASDRALAADVERDGIEAFVDRWERLLLRESQRALPADVRDALRAERLPCGARGLARSLPDARTEIGGGAGHAVHLERPAELARMVGGFVRGVQRT